jgi:hypothetical protein
MLTLDSTTFPSTPKTQTCFDSLQPLPPLLVVSEMDFSYIFIAYC